MDSEQFSLQLSVVVPVFNETGNILPLADEIRSTLDRRLRYELIFVDDGSVDATSGEIAEAVLRDTRVRSLHHSANLGQSAAVRSGVAAAEAKVVAVLDGDGQNDPRDLPRLYGQLRAVSKLGMVIGERRHCRDHWPRRVSSRLASRIRCRLLGDGIRDTGCGIKVFYRDAYLSLPAFDHMHRYLPALMQRSGTKVYAVPVNHRPRQYGRSKYGFSNRLWAGIADVLGVMWLQKRRL